MTDCLGIGLSNAGCQDPVAPVKAIKRNNDRLSPFFTKPDSYFSGDLIQNQHVKLILVCLYN